MFGRMTDRSKAPTVGSGETSGRLSNIVVISKAALGSPYREGSPTVVLSGVEMSAMGSVWSASERIPHRPRSGLKTSSFSLAYRCRVEATVRALETLHPPALIFFVIVAGDIGSPFSCNTALAASSTFMPRKGISASGCATHCLPSNVSSMPMIWSIPSRRRFRSAITSRYASRVSVIALLPMLCYREASGGKPPLAKFRRALTRSASFGSHLHNLPTLMVEEEPATIDWAPRRSNRHGAHHLHFSRTFKLILHQT